MIRCSRNVSSVRVRSLSSKKRLEDFRLQKSRDVMAEIHKAALERTSISVDKLISCLSEMQVIAQKQEVIVPITTRGVGFLVNESYQEAICACPKARNVCDDMTAYRVCLTQVQLNLIVISVWPQCWGYSLWTQCHFCNDAWTGRQHASIFSIDCWFR